MRTAVIALILLVSVVRSVQADSIVLYSNLGPSGLDYTSGFSYGLSGRTVAHQFTASESAFLLSIDIALSRDPAVALPPTDFTVSIRNDSANLPGAIFESWSLNSATLPSQIAGVEAVPPIQLLTAVAPFLTAGTRYWLAVTVPPSEGIEWGINHSQALPTTIGPPFEGPFTVPASAFRVTGSTEPIPEPGTLILVGSGLMAVARLKRFSQSKAGPQRRAAVSTRLSR